MSMVDPEGRGLPLAMRHVARYGLAAPFTPLSIAGLVAWYDFSDAATLFTDTARTVAVSADGQTIKGVTDKSGTGNHLSEATNPPTYKAALVGGQSGARFNGSSTLLNVANNATLQVTRYTLVAVLKHAATGTRQRYMIKFGGGTDFYSLELFTNWTAFECDGAAAHSATKAGSDTNAHIHVSRYSTGNALSRYVDGGTPGTGAGGGAQATNAGALTLGALTGGGDYFNGDYYEALLYNNDIGLTNLNLLGPYLASKWTPTWTTAT